MTRNGHTINILKKTVDKLSEEHSLKGLFHEHLDDDPLPSSKALEEVIEIARSILFPGFYGKSSVSMQTLNYHIGVNVEKLHKLLYQQILAGLCIQKPKECESVESVNTIVKKRAKDITMRVIEKLPEVRRVLATDVQAAYNGDPAAVSYGEIISCYPVIKALTNYRLAHEIFFQE